MTIINNYTALQDLTAKLEGAQSFALDTEFSRYNKFYPELQLVQVAINENPYIIDVFSLPNLTEFLQHITDQSKEKIIHACIGDLQAIYYAHDVFINNIFDTQLAAALCGMQEQISYEELVCKLFGVELDPLDERFKWHVRPLSTKQINYAKRDVLYSSRIKEILYKKLEDMNRVKWLTDDMQLLYQKFEKSIKGDDWSKLHIARPNRVNLGKIREIFSWREKTALNLNVPKQWILPDNILAMGNFRHIQELCLKKVKNPEDRENLTIILEEKFHESVQEQLLVEYYQAKSARQTGDKKFLRKLSEVREKTARELNIAPSIIANSKELKQLSLFEHTGKIPTRLKNSWRYDIFTKFILPNNSHF